MDLLLAGVGGQGVLSLGTLLAEACRREGHNVKMSEVHGMAQRGGAVLAHLRLSSGEIHSDLVPEGGADLLLATEPLEALRHLEHLCPEGTLVTSTAPRRNLPDYPELETLLDRLRELPRILLVDTDAACREARAGRSANVVLVGAACHLLPLAGETLEAVIRDTFTPKGPEAVAANLRALAAGREVAACPAA